MADTLLSPAKHELSGTGSLAGAVLRRLVLTEADLPEGIQFLPSLFRLMACLLFLPVAMLTLVDLIGWIFFKAVLRPLGYTSTIRFKDPEPPSMLFAPGVENSRPASPASSNGILPSEESSSSSGCSDAYPSPAFSDNLSLPDVDMPSSPQSRDADRRPKSSRKKSKKSRNAHYSEEDETSYRMSRDRAPSVGLDGPLFGDETDGAVTPGTESDSGDYLTSARGLPAGSDFTSPRSARGDGVPRGGFKLGLTEVTSRPTAAVVPEPDA